MDTDIKTHPHNLCLSVYICG